MTEKSELPENMLKYENYREQNKRLNKALQNEFYLEAVFIEYAIMEDRTESILRYEGNEIQSNRFVSIDKKIKEIKKLLVDEECLAGRYFTDEFMDQLLSWKNQRNGLIHALIKRNTTTQELIDLAEEGRILTKDLCRLSTNYKRAVERKKKQETGGIK